jgi:N-acetylneuraminate synthase
MLTHPKPIEIAGRPVGPGHPCFIIAEAGVNHNGQIDLARQLVEAAAKAKADAVKFQTFRADRLVTPMAAKARYQQGKTPADESHLEMIRRLELSPEAHIELMDLSRRSGILFLSTPFDEESADFLESLGVAAFKLPSGEVTNHRLLRHVARKSKPIILSTGMCNLGEVESAVRAIDSEGNCNLVLLHTVSNYPAEPSDVNLRAMQTMASAFQKLVGYSDHTLGIEVPLASVALGACVVEKHLTLDKSLPGPDHAASAEPHEFQQLVQSIRCVESALGDGIKTRRASEEDVAAVARRSLTIARQMKAGDPITPTDILIRRPGTGLPPAFAEFVIGRTLRCDAAAGTVLTLEMLS